MNRTGHEVTNAGHDLPKYGKEAGPNLQQMKVWFDQLGVKVTCKQIEHFISTFSLHVKK